MEIVLISHEKGYLQQAFSKILKNTGEWIHFEFIEPAALLKMNFIEVFFKGFV